MVRDFTAGFSNNSRSSDQRDGLAFWSFLELSEFLRLLLSPELVPVGLGVGLGGVVVTEAGPAGLGGINRLTNCRSANDQMLEVMK